MTQSPQKTQKSPKKILILILALGNPSRGDDALAPTLLEKLHQIGIETTHSVELLTDFQLQIEHALDLADREAVLFVDAALPNTGYGTAITPIHSDSEAPTTSHTLRPQAVLQVAQKILGDVPAAWLLAIEGESFALGEGLSTTAQQNLEKALALALEWLAVHSLPS